MSLGAVKLYAVKLKQTGLQIRFVVAVSFHLPFPPGGIIVDMDIIRYMPAIIGCLQNTYIYIYIIYYHILILPFLSVNKVVHVVSSLLLISQTTPE